MYREMKGDSMSTEKRFMSHCGTAYLEVEIAEDGVSAGISRHRKRMTVDVHRLMQKNTECIFSGPDDDGDFCVWVYREMLGVCFKKGSDVAVFPRKALECISGAYAAFEAMRRKESLKTMTDDKLHEALDRARRDVYCYDGEDDGDESERIERLHDLLIEAGSRNKK